MKLITVGLFSVVLTACVGPGSTMRTFPVSGGNTVSLPFARGGALSSQTSDVKIEVTGFMVDAEKSELTYTFGFTEKNGKTPMRVTVEDVTGATAVELVADLSPSISADGYWKGVSSARKAGDSSLAWLHEPGNTEKVFRFTIILNDGRTEEIFQASIWPGQSKPIIKRALKL
jgi:hypothetical protein